MQFKKDDKAVCTLTDQEVEIQFGPVRATLGHPAYLVKFPNGESSIVWADDLETAAKFKQGQTVRNRGGETMKLHVGPFPDHEGDLFWVAQEKDGTFSQVWEFQVFEPVT